MGAGPAVVTVRVKPRLRGVLHEVAFFVAVALAVPLLWTAPAGRARVAAVVFALCVPLCFGASALYHRPTWSPGVRSWLARVDHAGLYLLIAGTYTPFIMQMRSEITAIVLLVGVWAGSIAGMVLKLCLPGRFDRLAILLYLLLGWSGVMAYEAVLGALPGSTLTLLAAGGLLYTVGVVFHVWEGLRFQNAIWHVFVLVAAACHYGAVLDCVVLARA
jgi:hemolysin III